MGDKTSPVTFRGGPEGAVHVVCQIFHMLHTRGELPVGSVAMSMGSESGPSPNIFLAVMKQV